MKNKPADFFSPDYFTARARFHEKVEKAKGRLQSLELEAKGPNAEPLNIDIAWFGAEPPRHVFLHCAGLHGVEGFPGSAIQLQFLNDGIPSVPDDAAIGLVHILNPYGMAWLRRFNENNVDLNRNFLAPDEDYKGAPPGYKKLDAFLNPPSLPTWDFFSLRGGWLIARYGMSALTQTVAGGQYEYPRGLFFGGKQFEEGPRKYQAYIAERLATVERLVVIDVHTGLGPFGEASLMAAGFLECSPLYDEIRNAFGKCVAPVVSEEIEFFCQGAHETIFPRVRPNARVYFVTQEFGTYSSVKVLHALREENRWHHHGDGSVDHPAKRKLLETFSPDNDSWQQLVLSRGKELLGQALELAFGGSN
jgi:hypothetical protein